MERALSRSEVFKQFGGAAEENFVIRTNAFVTHKLIADN